MATNAIHETTVHPASATHPPPGNNPNVGNNNSGAKRPRYGNAVIAHSPHKPIAKNCGIAAEKPATSGNAKPKIALAPAPLHRPVNKIIVGRSPRVISAYSQSISPQASQLSYVFLLMSDVRCPMSVIADVGRGQVVCLLVDKPPLQ
jgi:hypothetical protein